MSRRLLLPAMAVSLTLFAAACGAGSDDAGTVDESTATPPAETATDDGAMPNEDTDAAPDADVPGLLQFTAPLVGGGEIDAAELSGKPTAFWFWSPT